MKTLYKLTNVRGRTHNGTQWGEGVEHKAKGDASQALCTNGWIHAYEDPLVAAFMNPIHANFSPAVLWEAKGEIGKRDGPLKCGCRRLKTVRRIPLPKITTLARVRVAILLTKLVYRETAWNRWADAWLNGKNRGAKAASAATWAAEAATDRAADIADWNTAEVEAAAASAWAAEAAADTVASAGEAVAKAARAVASAMAAATKELPLATTIRKNLWA